MEERNYLKLFHAVKNMRERQIERKRLFNKSFVINLLNAEN